MLEMKNAANETCREQCEVDLLITVSFCVLEDYVVKCCSWTLLSSVPFIHYTCVYILHF